MHKAGTRQETNPEGTAALVQFCSLCREQQGVPESGDKGDQMVILGDAY